MCLLSTCYVPDTVLSVFISVNLHSPERRRNKAIVLLLMLDGGGHFGDGRGVGGGLIFKGGVE